MIPAAPATSAQEMPVFFPAGDHTLFGVFTYPPGDAIGTAAVILSGGGATAPATNRNRLSVHLSRSLAAAGYHAMRFDYHGIGESTGVLAGAPRVDEPYLADVDGAVGWIRERGIERFVLIGSCFGGRTALSYAPTLPGLESVVLVSPPLRDLELGEDAATRLANSLSVRQSVGRAAPLRTVRGLFHPARRQAYRHFVKAKASALFGTNGNGDSAGWLSPKFVDPIRDLAAREIPLLFVYGTKDYHYEDFVLARSGRLGEVLEGAPLTHVALIEDDVHGLTRVGVQQRVSELILDRLQPASAKQVMET